MLQNNTALAPRNAPNPTDNPGTEQTGPEDGVTVDTQFGPMTFHEEAILTFPSGLLGFGGHARYGLANLPDPAYGNFKLMQSLDGSGLGFLVLPLDGLPDHIHEDDIAEALTAHGIAPENAAILLIVTVRKTEERAILSVNLRAPVVIDTVKHRAVQHVLPNSAYPIRHEL